MREGRGAVALTPTEKDALSTPLLVTHLATIAVGVGESDLAFKILQKQAAERLQSLFQGVSKPARGSRAVIARLLMRVERLRG